MKRILLPVLLIVAFFAARHPPSATRYSLFPLPARAQSIDTSPPAQPVKLIFIHHSVGENWLTDGYGDLGLTLAQNNYFVSDTNYGWGPDGIGDRTDIVDWPEWFVGPESERYMQAVYSESGQHADYTRLFDDPGGENTIVMFKSCFPNSELAGSPDDPPDPEVDYTVGHAKYVYNQLLTYFAAHPDKLFIVITAPPVQDPAYADNARAFNTWLVNDWLWDAGYSLNNVAVFDFYNVLTHPDNHHYIVNGNVAAHIYNDHNTLYYDSDGDNHPNPEGSRKATEEFVPLLNYYYNLWIAMDNPAVEPPPEEVPTPETETQTPPEATSPPESESPPEAEPVNLAPGVIDNFEDGAPPYTGGWEAFTDEANPDTTLSCGVDSSVAAEGSGSLRIDFYIEPDSWAACALFYDQIFDWSDSAGITFRYRADAPEHEFAVTVHGGTPDESTSYQHIIETAPESTEGWVSVELTWDQILGVEWEDDVNNPVDPAEITGISFEFDAEDEPNTGTLWVDSLTRWDEATPAGTAETAASPEAGSDQPQSESEAPTEGGGLPCMGSSLLGAAMLFGAVWQSTKRKKA